MADLDITAETPLIERMVTPVFHDLGPGISARSSIPEVDAIFTANFTKARKLKGGERLPQAVAHRGYKAKYPENTMGAFEGAVKVGAHAIETDVHLSKDGVVVLTHDANLKRCFGREEKVVDCTWEELSTLRTVREPHSPMPRLLDLLRYLAQPELDDIWVLLDIKLDNKGDDIMRLIAETIAEVETRSGRTWNERIVLGCWTAHYVPLCNEYLSGFPITHIGFSTVYAQQFFSVPNVSFNMMHQILLGPRGKAFLQKSRRLNRPVFDWTVNNEEMMRWSISRELDAVITDDPKLFLDVCDGWSRNPRMGGFSFMVWYDILKVNVIAFLFGFLFRWKYRKDLNQKSKHKVDR